MNEIKLDAQQIVVIQGSIEFNEYDHIKKQAVALSEQIAAVEVNEENIKQSKKLLAAVNKRLKELEDKRISVKRTMLEPYQIFEEQVKEIVNIVKTADAAVRDQVKYLEEFERLEKEAAIEELFKKRKQQYKLFSAEVPQFHDFLQAKHLNKSTSLATVENEMIIWFEKIRVDFEVIQTLPNANEVLSVYIGLYDLARAISLVNVQEQARQAAEATGVLNKTATKKAWVIVIYEEKDLTLLKMFMDNNEIKFDVKEGF